MIVTALHSDAMDELAMALGEAGLPTSDLNEPGRRFFRIEDTDGVLGYAGLEGAGTRRLLRSVVVPSSRRGQGHGQAVLAAIERIAGEDGATTLYLLTTTAEPFFRRHGYMVTERATAPAEISSSAEFCSLCPAGAAFLHKRIV